MSLFTVLRESAVCPGLLPAGAVMTHRQTTARSAFSAAALLVAGLLLGSASWCLPPRVMAAPRTVENAPAGLNLSEATYRLPAVKLQDEAGRKVDLQQLFATRRPMIVNFIFTSCPEICPVMTGTQLQLQRQLRDDPTNPLFVSITLDPDQDTPEVLAEYAERFGANWKFLTGGRAEVLQTLQAFDAWRGNKMNHAAVTLLRRNPGAPWTRVEGLAPASALASVWRDMGQ
jgi:protein SCO1